MGKHCIGFIVEGERFNKFFNKKQPLVCVYYLYNNKLHLIIQ